MAEVSGILRVIGKDQATSEIRKVRGAVNELQQTAKKGGLENLLGPLTSRVSAAAITTSLGLIVKSSIHAASALEALQHRAKAIYGDSFPAMEQRLDLLSVSLNRASSDILKLSTDFSGTLQGFSLPRAAIEDMSVSLTKLSVDFGSFFQVADEEAFQLIQGGMLGMGRALARYGIVLNDTTLQEYAFAKGIRTKLTDMNEAQQVALRYQFIMDKTKNIQGEAARNTANLSNQFKALKGAVSDAYEELGQPILPTATKGLSVLTGYLSHVFVPSVKTAAQEWAAFMQLIGSSSYGQEVGGRFQKIFGGSPGDVMGLVTGKSREIKNYQQDLSLEDVIGSTGKSGAGAARDVKALVESLAGGSSSLAGGSKEAADELDRVKEAMDDLAQSYKEKARDIDQSVSQLEEGHREKMQSIKEEIQGVQNQLADLARGYERALGDIDRSQADLLIRQDGKITGLTEKLDELNKKRESIAQNGGSVPVSMTEEIEKLLAEIEQERRALETVKGQAGTGVLSTYGDRSKLSDFERDYSDQEGRRSELQDDTKRRREELEKELTTLNDKKTLETEVFMNSRQQLMLTQIAVSAFESDYTSAMGDINKVTEDTVKNLKTQLEQMKSAISEIDALVKARADLTGGGSVAERRALRLAETPDSYLVPNANGGIYDKPTAALIGEAGYPEAVIPMPFGNVPVKIQGDSGSKSIFNAPIIGQVIVKNEADEDRLIRKITRILQLGPLAA